MIRTAIWAAAVPANSKIMPAHHSAPRMKAKNYALYFFVTLSAAVTSACDRSDDVVDFRSAMMRNLQGGWKVYAVNKEVVTFPYCAIGHYSVAFAPTISASSTQTKKIGAPERFSGWTKAADLGDMESWPTLMPQLIARNEHCLEGEAQDLIKGLLGKSKTHVFHSQNDGDYIYIINTVPMRYDHTAPVYGMLYMSK